MKIKSLITLVLLLSATVVIRAQEAGKYKYYVDLTKVVEDKLKVTLETPSLDENEITFYMPKIIPGTYSIHDYGRFVSDLKAFDKKGNELSVKRKDDNTWVISKAKKLKRITYWVEDSFDYKGEGPEVFWPSGTNIEEDNFMINSAGFFGYFKGMKRIPFEFNIARNESFYGGTGLIPQKDPTKMEGTIELTDGFEVSSGTVVDSYLADNYDHLVDSPLLYAETDTAIIKVANTEVLISTYSPNKIINSKQIAETLTETLSAQAAFLGGTLPVEKYAFMFHFTDLPVQSYGALEHSYSSMYFIPEGNIEMLNQTLRDFAAHEFFHIITPLTIHSEEIHQFDFNDPQMSRHLWLYEGVTEYFSGQVQVQNDMIDPGQYMDMIRTKLITSMNFYDTVAFTDISRNILEEYEDQFYNVYQKGALIGLSLDLQLLKLSNGEYSLRDLILDLSERYGKNQAFKDDELFDVIGNMTYPEIREFIKTHVEGEKPINYSEIFDIVGINFQPEFEVEVVSIGLNNQTITVDQESERLVIQNEEMLDEFGKALGFKNGDQLIKIAGREIPPLGPELQQFIYEIQSGVAEGKELSYTVIRTDENGEEAEIRLAKENFKVKQKEYFVMFPNENATAEQEELRNIWFSGQ